MVLPKTYDILHLKRIVFAFFMAFAFLLFNGCNQSVNHLDIVRGKMLDRIEAQMFQQSEGLESLLGNVDTTNITPHEQARLGTISGFFHFENGEYGKSIHELEKAETFFLKRGDHYHLHICKLIKAFTFEYLDLDHNAASLYVECESYFDVHHLDQFKFYATLGLFRMAKQLKLDEKVLLDKLKKAAGQFNNPNYNGLLYATMGVFEKNDSLKSIYYDLAKSEFKSVKRWSRVYAIEINTLYVKIRQDYSDDTQLYYDNFNNKTYNYTPTIKQIMRYKYGQAYLYAKQGKNKQSIEVANKVLKEASEFKITNVESDCVELLAYLYKRIGDFANAHQMLERYHSLQKKDLDELQQIRLLAFGAHYRYSELEREKLELKLSNQKSLLLFSIISLVLIVGLSFVWFLWKDSKHKQAILKLKNIEIEDQMSNLIHSLEQKENKNTYLINQVEDWKVQYKDSLEISKFLQAIDQNQITNWIEYEACFIKLRPGWIEKLKHQFPELTATDLKYCMCLYFNLNNFTVGKLCETRMDGVKSAKQRIRHKFLLKDATEIYHFLKRFDEKND